ncbi:MAG: GOLPH3/VPS74 family protein [Gaiellaceae bacterium]
MLIAEDLLLLLTDDQTGRLIASSNQVDVALGGALLLELTLTHRVDVTGESEAIRKGQLVVMDESATSDALLDEALAMLGTKQGKKPKDVVTALGKGLRDRLHARLVDRGLLREASGKILGIFPTHRWPANDAAHEDSVRALLTDALRIGATDDLRVAALVSLLHALKAVEKVIDPVTVGVTKNEMKANAERIAEGNWASEAVRKAIDEAMAAVIAATSSVTVVSASP